MFEPLFTPVPPYVGPISDPCQVPVPIVPRVVMDVCPTYAAEISTESVFTVILLAVPTTSYAFPFCIRPAPAVAADAPEN